MILINKQLNRNDGLIIPSGSILDFKVRKIERDLNLHFILKHYVNFQGFEDKLLPINSNKDFSYKVYINLPEKQFETLTDYSIEMILKEFIDSKLGVGYTQIIK
jgi:hypothetical protein